MARTRTPRPAEPQATYTSSGVKRGRRLAPLEQGLLGRLGNRAQQHTHRLLLCGIRGVQPLLAKQALQGTEALLSGGSRDAGAKVAYGHVDEICRRVLLEAGVNGDSPSTTIVASGCDLECHGHGVMAPSWAATLAASLLLNLASRCRSSVCCSVRLSRARAATPPRERSSGTSK